MKKKQTVHKLQADVKFTKKKKIFRAPNITYYSLNHKNIQIT